MIIYRHTDVLNKQVDTKNLLSTYLLDLISLVVSTHHMLISPAFNDLFWESTWKTYKLRSRN